MPSAVSFAGFSVAEAQRTVFVIFEAHETCIFFFNSNGEKFLRLVVHGPIEDLTGILRQ
jgi:hypothetical protein